MVENEQTEILLALFNIEDRLQEILEILRVSNKETVKAAQRKVLAGSQLRRKISDLCNGTNSVSEIAKQLNKSVQQISNNITLLQNAGIIKEVRRGKEKFYLRTK